MDAAGYAALTRQSGLMREMQVVANNIANLSTTGFRREGVVFSEYVNGDWTKSPSLSMAHGSGRMVDLSQAGVSQTGGTFDFAIQGEGFFLIETPEGNRLTRAGSFHPERPKANWSP
jgi:flagellar basal-body rod protein FlgF